MAKVIAKSIQSANSQLSKLITNYNAQLWNHPPLSVTMAEVRNPDSTLWANVPAPRHNLIPHAIQVKLVELTAKRSRCAEEEDIVLQEMKNVLHYYDEELAKVYNSQSYHD